MRREPAQAHGLEQPGIGGPAPVVDPEAGGDAPLGVTGPPWISRSVLGEHQAQGEDPFLASAKQGQGTAAPSFNRAMAASTREGSTDSSWTMR